MDRNCLPCGQVPYHNNNNNNKKLLSVWDTTLLLWFNLKPTSSEPGQHLNDELPTPPAGHFVKVQSDTVRSRGRTQYCTPERKPQKHGKLLRYAFRLCLIIHIFLIGWWGGMKQEGPPWLSPGWIKKPLCIDSPGWGFHPDPLEHWF